MENLFILKGDWIPIYRAATMIPGRKGKNIGIRSLRNKIYAGHFPAGTVTKSIRGVWYFRESYIMGLMERGGVVIPMYQTEHKQTA